MDEKNELAQKKIRQTINSLESAGQAMEQNLTSILDDPDSKEVARLLLAAGACCDERIDSKTFDPETNWQAFQKKSMPKRKSSYVLFGSVAVLLVLVALSIFIRRPQHTVTLFAATQGAKGITLTCGHLAPITITDELIDLTHAKFNMSQDYTIETTAGCEILIILPDSSTVRLNSLSKLYYHPTSQERFVTLTGEAYFNVHKTPNRPFLIRTREVTAKVLGTSFNIRDYDQERLQILLVHGSLSIETKNTPLKTIMRPGEEADIQADGQVQIKKSDSTHSALWTQGYFMFDDSPLSDIMRELGRSYNLTIKAFNDKVTDKRFHFKCKRSLGIDRIIEMLNEQGEFKISRKGNTVFIE